MTEPNPLYPGQPLVPGYNSAAHRLLAEIDGMIGEIRDEQYRGGAQQMRELAVVVAAALAGGQLNGAPAERIAAAIPHPSRGHLGAAIAIIVSTRQATAGGALELLTLVRNHVYATRALLQQ